MAPPRRGNEKGQISMLEFTKPPTPTRTEPSPRPSSRPSSQRPSSQKSALRPLPCPTSSPFFRQTASKPKRRPSIGSPADDAWKIGELVTTGQKIDPQVLYGDDGAAHDSESDFEHDVVVRHRVARQRPSLKRKNLTSGLRDDRVSMTKRSANKRGKKRSSVAIPTQASVFDDEDGVDGTPSSARKRGLRTNDVVVVEDDCELVLVEGERLEMSGTEEEDDSALSSPVASRSEKRRRISLAGSLVTPAEKRASDAQFKTPEEFPLNAEGLLSQCKNAPRKAPSKATDLEGGGTSTSRRPRVLPRLFDSDSDDSLTAQKSRSGKGSKEWSVSASDSCSSDDDIPDAPATTRCKRVKSPLASRSHSPKDAAIRKKSVFDSDSSSPEPDPEPTTLPFKTDYVEGRTPRQTRRIVARKTKRKPQNIPVVSSDSSEQEDADPETINLSSEGSSAEASEEEEGVCSPEQTRKRVTRSATKKTRRNSQRYEAPGIDLRGLGDDTLSGHDNPPDDDSDGGSVLSSRLSISPVPTPLPPLSRKRNLRKHKVFVTPESTPSPPSIRKGSTGMPTRPEASPSPPSINMSVTPESTPSPLSIRKGSTGRLTTPDASPSPPSINKLHTSILPGGLESTPSPPSTKKRKRRQRLMSRYSDDEAVLAAKEAEKRGQASESRKTPESTRKDVQPQSASKCTPGSEWFLERQIEDFSSSSADFRMRCFEEIEHAGSKSKKSSQSRRRSAAVPPVRRDILKSLEAERADNYKRLSPGNTPTQSPEISAAPVAPHRGEDDAPREQCDEVVDLIDIDEEDALVGVVETDSPMNVDEIRNSSSVPSVSVIEADEVIPIDDDDDDKPPPFNLVVLCNSGETIRQMKERLGEEVLMDRVIEAQQAGREIIGGEELGLTGSFNRNVFNRFSRQVVGDQLGRERKAKVVTEQAMRGEYQFNYRGKNRENQPFRGKGGRKGSRGGKKSRGSGRLSNLRRRLE